MQLIFLPRLWMLFSCFVGWLFFHILSVIVANRLPARFLCKPGIFREFHFESGLFYRRVFKVDKWKELLPDGSAASGNGFQKKRLAGKDSEYIRKFILESKRAEAAHWLAIFPFWIFGLWTPPIVVPFMLLYSLAANIPCIIAQRYNRPRLRRVLMHLEGHSES